jgi:thiosulfate dehydrogenase [quinone] large subunit
MSKECCSEPCQETPAGSSRESCCPSNKLALIYGSWLLRIWLAVRAIQTGVEKFAGTKSADQIVKVDGAPNEEGLTAAGSLKVYALEHYHGVPEMLVKKFEAEPLLHHVLWTFKDPEKSPITLVTVYGWILGPALIILGLTILLGLAYRTSLFLLGLLYISLTWGLILIKQDDGVSWLGVHMIMIVMALALANHNRIGILKKW